MLKVTEQKINKYYHDIYEKCKKYNIEVVFIKARRAGYHPVFFKLKDNDNTNKNNGRA